MSINLTLSDIETQNWNVRWNTKTVLGKSKKNSKKNCLEPNTFRTSNISKIEGPVTFLLYKLGCYFSLNWRGYETTLRIQR